MLGLRLLSPSNWNIAFQRKRHPSGRYGPKYMNIDYRQNQAETVTWLSLRAKSHTCVNAVRHASNRLFSSELAFAVAAAQRTSESRADAPRLSRRLMFYVRGGGIVEAGSGIEPL